MDTVICTQHADIPARWRCRECELSFCSYCVPPDPRRGAQAPDCLCCLKPLDSLGLDNVIAPFWQQLPLFLRMPLETDTLLLTIGLALVFALMGELVALRMLVPLLLLLWAASSAYLLQGTRMLHRVAHGYMKAPLRPLPDRPGFLNLLKQSLLFVLLFGGVGVAAAVLHSPVIAAVLMALAVLLLPAAMITVITTDRLGTALNPAFLIGAAFRIGWPYLLLWGLLLLISGGSGQLHKLLVQMHFPLGMALALNSFVSMYFGLVTMALMGYVAFQHHEVFGLEVRDPALESGEGKPAKALQPPDRAQLLIARGKVDEAQADLEQRLRRQPEQFELQALYQRLLLAKRDGAAASAHAREFIGRLLQARRDDQAWRVYADYAAKLGALEIREGADCVRLAAVACQHKQGRQALPLLDKFAQRFPEHPDIPQAWLLTAQILTEELHEDAKSRAILTALIRRYPDSPVRQQAERYVALLERLAASGARAAPRPG